MTLETGLAFTTMAFVMITCAEISLYLFIFCYYYSTITFFMDSSVLETEFQMCL